MTPPIMRCIAGVATAFALFATSPVDGQQRERARSAVAVVGETPPELRVRDDTGASHQFGASAWTVGDGTPAAMQFALPPRRFQLRGGDHFTAELLELDAERFRLGLRGGAVVDVPRSAVAQFGPLPGWRDVIAWTALPNTVGPNAIGATNGLGLPLRPAFERGGVERGMVAVAFEDPPPAAKRADMLRLILSGENWSGTLALRREDELIRLEVLDGFRLATVPVQPQPGRQVLTGEFDANDLRLMLNGAVIGRGEGVQSVNSVRVEGAHRLTSLHALARVDSGRVDSSSAPAAAGGLDAVTDYDGNTLFGTVRQAGDGNFRPLVLAASFGEVELPWRDVAAVMLADRTSADPPTASISGWVSTLTFRPLVGGQTDRLTVAVRAADGRRITVAHETLGEVTFSLSEIRRIEPIFLGTRRTLATGPLHLGDDVRRDFQSPRAGGARVEGSWTHQSAGRTFLRLRTRDLSPAGPGTALGSPHLRELRQGEFVTRLKVNGRVVATLNRLISTSDGEASFRLEVPADVLRDGENTWSIEQTPLTPAGEEYDDCEIGPIVLEIEAVQSR